MLFMGRRYLKSLSNEIPAYGTGKKKKKKSGKLYEDQVD